MKTGSRQRRRRLSRSRPPAATTSRWLRVVNCHAESRILASPLGKTIRAAAGKAASPALGQCRAGVCCCSSALPSAIYIFIARAHPGFVEGLHYVVTCVYALTSLMLLWEAWAAWRVPPGATKPPMTTCLPCPDCTAIIAAYLPNEQDIILETVQHMLTQVDVPAGPVPGHSRL